MLTNKGRGWNNEERRRKRKRGKERKGELGNIRSSLKGRR